MVIKNIFWFKLLFLLLILIVSPFITMTMGVADISISDIISILKSHLLDAPMHEEITRATDAIVWQIRLPRILVAIAVGAILGVSGVILQSVVRNPLAEPYILGISSGASTGVAIAIIFLSTSSFSVSIMAFLGAMLATAIVLLMAGNSNSPLKLVLAGLATNFGFQALTNLLLFSSGSPETNQSVMFWMLGSLGHTGLDDIWQVSLIAAMLVLVSYILGPVLDAISSGDNTALSVGINPAIFRILLLIPVSLAIATAVSVAGGIGFIGLVIPHFMRNFVGANHRALIPASALAAAIFLLWTDSFARVFFAPTELPIGVITGIIGAPCLMILLRKQK